MDTEIPARENPFSLSSRKAAYLLSLCLHAGLAVIAWTMLPDRAHVHTVSPVTEVELVELPAAGPTGDGLPPGPPGRGMQKKQPGPVRAEAMPEPPPIEITKPLPAPDTRMQESDEAEKISALGTLSAQESITALPAGGPPGGGSSGRQGSGGTGGGTSAGQGSGGTGQGPGGSGSVAGGSALQGYYAAIRARIEAAKQYPLSARKRHMEGHALVSFRLSRDGKLLTVQIEKSSGNSLLDEAALSAVRNGAPYPTCPCEGDGAPDPMTVSIAFILR